MQENTALKEYSIDRIPHKILGRTGSVKSPLPLFWNGSGVEICVSGTELWIEVEADYNYYEPWIAVYIDGAFMARQMITAGRHKICLFRNMSDTPVKNVRFVRELQPMSGDDNCRLLVHGFSSDGCFETVPEKKLRLEFVGDSITSGEGTYGIGQDIPWISMYMSSSRNYATMIATALDAECRLISQGGWGVMTSWDNNPNCAIPAIYEKVCGLAYGAENEKLGAAEPYNFAEWQPHAVVINLGTNDTSAFREAPWTDPETGKTYKQHTLEDGSYDPEDLQKFQNAVKSFLKTLRKCNPDAHLVWVYGMLGYDMTIPIAEAIGDYKAETKDLKVSFLQLPNTTDETVGSRFHPGVKSHENAAKVLTAHLQSLLNI